MAEYYAHVRIDTTINDNYAKTSYRSLYKKKTRYITLTVLGTLERENKNISIVEMCEIIAHRVE